MPFTGRGGSSPPSDTIANHTSTAACGVRNLGFDLRDIGPVVEAHFYRERLVKRDKHGRVVVFEPCEEGREVGKFSFYVFAAQGQVGNVASESG